MNPNKLATEILSAVGGKENITSATHCMTRLRLNFNDESKVNDDTIKAIQGVIGVVHAGSQTQIVIGQGVDKVYDEFVKLAGLEHVSAVEENLDTPKQKLTLKTVGNNIMSAVSGSITPVLPVFIIAGIFKMVVVLFGPKNLGLIAEGTNLYILCNLVNDALYYFLPFMVAYSASRKFKADPILSMAVIAISLHPTFLGMVSEGTAFSIYGLPVKMISYAQAVIPVIIIVWALSYVEKFVKKIVPTILRTIGVPVLVMLIMLPLAYCLLGPICNVIMSCVANAIIWLNNTIGIFAIIIVAAVWTLIIAFGMHVPVMVALLPVWMEMGYDAIVSPAGIAVVFANLGIELAYALRANSVENKELGWTCFITNFTANIGEPFIYGIYLRDKFAMAWHVLAAMGGAAVMGILGAKVTMFSGVGFPILNFLRFGEYAIQGAIGCATSFVIAVTLGFIFGFEKKKN